MEKRLGRQFVDSYSKYPLRFLVTNPETDETVGMHDFYYMPGEVSEVGTFINRGYFQPIEDFLYDSTEISEAISRTRALIVSNFLAINQSVTNLESQANSKLSDLNTTLSASYLRVIAVQNSLANYAPLSGANFTNPRANSPAAADNSTRIATTENVRNFVAQYPFPPKNVKDINVRAGELKISMNWSDPTDFVYDGMTLSEWADTSLVYRTDRYPISATDGVVATIANYRDEYKTYEFTLEGVRAGTTYYFQAFPRSVDDIYNTNALNRGAAIPEPQMQLLDDFSYARHSYAAAADGGGRILFGGGYTSLGTTDTVEIFGMYGQHLITTLSVARNTLVAETDSAGKAVFAGGYTKTSDYSDAIDIFSSSGAHSTSILSVPRTGLAAAREGSGGILFGGGYLNGTSQDTVDKLTSSGNIFTIIPLSVARTNLAAAFSAGNTIFGGGYTIIPTYSGAVDRYSSTGIHSKLDDLSIARSDLAAAATGDGSVLFVGGYNGTWIANVDRYSSTGIKSNLDSLAAARYNLAEATDGNGMALFGGGNTATGFYAIIDRYSSTGIKNSSVNLSFARSHSAAATDILGNVLFGGGVGFVSGSVSGYSGVVDRYTIQN